jgi:FKBP-type peptidyl-prolyl cis-trans isomerase SlyD
MSLPIEPGRFITLAMRVSNSEGEELERIDPSDPLSLFHGDGFLPEALEAALTGKTVGDSVQLTLDAEQAYGPHDPEQLVPIPRADLPEGLEVRPGDILPIELEPEEEDGPDAEPEEIEVPVVEVNEDAIVVDLNHPFAGQALKFEVSVLEVEEGEEA